MGRLRNLIEVNMSEFIGLSNYRESNRVNQNYIFESKNAFFDRGKIVASPGHDPFLPALTGGTNIQAMQSYEFNTGSAYEPHLVYQYDKEWYNVDLLTNVRTALSAGLAFDEQADTAQYINRVYAVSPQNGGQRIEGNTFTPLPGVPLGTMIEFAWEKMWITGVQASEATVYGSVTATAFAINNVEDFAGAGNVAELVGKGGRNTAMKFFKDSLYIFKKNEIHFIKPDFDSSVVTYFPKPFSVTGGAINDRSTIVVENDVWFLTPDLQVRSLGSEQQYIADTRTRELTSIIRGIMDELATDQENVAVAHYSNRIYTLALATKGSSTANIVIKYNYDNQGWSVDRYPAVKQWETADNKTFMATINSGQLYQDRLSYTFGGEFEIPWSIKTPFYDNLRPDMNYRARKIYIRGRRSRGVPITVKLYRHDYSTFSTYVIPPPTDAETNTTPGPGQFGQLQFGGESFAGDGNPSSSDLPDVFVYEKNISTSQMSNMFAVGLETDLLGQRIEVDQIILGMQPGSKQPFNI